MPAAKRDVRGTVWFGKERLPVAAAQRAPPLHASDHTPSQQSYGRRVLRPKSPPQRQSIQNLVRREILEQDPWEIYEPCAGIFYGRPMVLARDRRSKMELVHIQMQTVERSTIEIRARTIDELAHRSFLQLLNVLQHGKRYFLVWEPFEFSLHELLASKCRITESELAQIMWPILKGIRFLRDQSRELASLTPRDILFTQEGGVKIAGIENSRQIDTSNADTMTSALNDIVSIVDRMMQKNGFRAILARTSPAKYLNDLFRHPFFGQMSGEGGLKMLVELVNRTAHHEVKIRRESALYEPGAKGKPVRLVTT
ncbi:hypothetical protein BDV59DRAFT_194492 [Aspergillus ambiguus]|uniref:uncharacterized protein n=1 Tax=Aspergillus ambiguus TaxID=176160 RepID=UPI003CCD2696